MSSPVPAWRAGYERLRREFESKRRLELYHLRFQPVGDAVELPNRWREGIEAAEIRRESVWQPGCPGLPTYEHAKQGILYGSRAAAELFDHLAAEAWQAVPGSPDGKEQSVAFARHNTDRWLTLVYRQLSDARGQGLNYLEEGDWVVIRKEGGDEVIEPAERYALPMTYGPIRNPDPRPSLLLPFERWRVTRPTVDLFTASVTALDLLLANSDPEGMRIVSFEELQAWIHSPAFQNANHVLDYIILGNGGLFPIYRRSCRVIPGKVPSVCPKARPSLPPDFLPTVTDVYRERGFLGEGETVHWVGNVATIEGVCTCGRAWTPTPDRQADNEQAPRGSLKQPTPEALMAYRLLVATGKNQTELAQLMTEELNKDGRRRGRIISQGTVSRWISWVKTWLEAGNVLPDLSQSGTQKPAAMDPERIDLGPHGEHRPKHQRKHRTSDGDE
jgi:hypothetical protein